MKTLDERHLIAIPIIFIRADENKWHTDDIYMDVISWLDSDNIVNNIYILW